MTYADKLLDPRWQKKRLEILQRDVWTCQNCYSKEKTLHVHHSFYFRNIEPWEYPSYSLFTLCKECHSELTATKDIEEEIIFRLLGGLKNTFIRGCAKEVFSRYDINDIIYYLWELSKEFKEETITCKELSKYNYV